MPKENPYIAGNPVGKTNSFIGRTDILNELENFLQHSHQNAIVLYGQRRIGKTSLLHFLERSLPKVGNFAPVYYNLQDKASWSLSKLLENLAKTINSDLNINIPLNGKTDDEIQLNFRSEWLPSLLKNLPNNETLTNLDALVILFDEFDVLADPASEKAGATFFPYFRHLILDDPDRLKFVFTLGRNIDDLNTGALSLFKDIRAKRVSLLNQEETFNLINLSAKNETLFWSEESLNYIWSLSHGHPYLTQQLCFSAWLKYHRPNRAQKTLTPKDIDSILDDTLDASRTALEWIWEGLPPAERIVISALAEAGHKLATQTDLEKILNESGIKIIIRELQNAPRLLEDWDLIEPRGDGYIFRVELLRRWLSKYKKLKTVIDETDRIKPAAENLYQAAHNLYNDGQSDQLDQVLNFLQESIRLNPNHLKANGLLSDIFISKNQLDDAQRILDSLYEIHPNAARARLIQLYFARISQATNEEEKIIYLNKILGISPDNSEAIKILSTIWKNRGDKALRDYQLEEALEAFQNANDRDNYNLVVGMIREEELHLFLTEINSLENEKRYDDALELIDSKAETFSWHDWKSNITRLKQKSDLTNLLSRAKAAFESQDYQMSQEHLIKIINIDPYFENATQYLFMTTKKDYLDQEQKILSLETQILSLQNTIALSDKASEVNKNERQSLQIEKERDSRILQTQIVMLRRELEDEKKRVEELEQEKSRLTEQINSSNFDQKEITTRSESRSLAEKKAVIAFLILLQIIETIFIIIILSSVAP